MYIFGVTIPLDVCVSQGLCTFCGAYVLTKKKKKEIHLKKKKNINNIQMKI